MISRIGLAAVGSAFLSSLFAMGGCNPPPSAELPQIARTDAEFAALMRRFEADRKDREIAYYREEVECLELYFRQLVQVIEEGMSTIAIHRFTPATQADEAEINRSMTFELDLARSREHKFALMRHKISNLLTTDRFGPTTWEEAEDLNLRKFRAFHQTAERQLAQRTPRIHFSDTALQEAVRLVCVTVGCQFAFDWQALENVGINRNTKVRLEVEVVSVKEALHAILHQADPDGRAVLAPFDNVIVITTAEAADRTRKLLADSLARSDPAGRKMLNTVQEFRLAYVSPGDFCKFLADLCHRRLVLDEYALKQAHPRDASGSLNHTCPVGLGARLFLDEVAGEAPWTFRVVGEEMILEPAVR